MKLCYLATFVLIPRRPFAGAWIETVAAAEHAHRVKVAPSRGRGLKLLGLAMDLLEVAVAPSRGRGLKHRSPDLTGRDGGRPFAGAWIETTDSSAGGEVRDGSPLRGGVD